MTDTIQEGFPTGKQFREAIHLGKYSEVANFGNLVLRCYQGNWKIWNISFSPIWYDFNDTNIHFSFLFNRICNNSSLRFSTFDFWLHCATLLSSKVGFDTSSPSVAQNVIYRNISYSCLSSSWNTDRYLGSSTIFHEARRKCITLHIFCIS